MAPGSRRQAWLAAISLAACSAISCGSGSTCGDDCGECTPSWHDVGTCECTPSECASCDATKPQADDCGNTRAVDCTVAATGCDGTCCGDECCGPNDYCDVDTCVACDLDCAAGELCTPLGCAPAALLLAGPGAATPSLWCPPGYEEAGHWRPGPDAADGAVEGFDFQHYAIDNGWMWLCSADPAAVKVTVGDDECGATPSSCAGEVRGSWHVGTGCEGAGSQGVDASGAQLEAGWLDLCVAPALEVEVETGHNDCGTAGPGCGALRTAGSWHTNPASCGGEDAGIGAGGTAIESGWLELCVDSARYPAVDTATLTGKVMAGYQGWFGAPGDGSVSNSWRHWFRSQTPTADNATFDLWPDLSELDPDELFDTSLTYGGGGTARVFSAFSAKTVLRHMRWMADYGIDGAFLQRFLSEVTAGSAGLEFRDQVARNVMAGAEANGRSFAIMYDISGANAATLVQALTDDWKHLVDDLGVTASARYQHHGGLPLVAIWGLGFTDRPGTVSDAEAIVDFFHNNPEPAYRAAVMGGVPTHWRTGTGDSQPGFDAVYRSFDVISPWSVGRYGDISGADAFAANQIQPDLTEAAAAGRDYLPVVWPGFSWANLMQDPGVFNAIPRAGGAFYWRQLINAQTSGCTMIYLAMFDEVDEGTAVFKAAPTQASLPAQGQFLSLDADGISVPGDWYLRLSGAAAKALAGQIPSSDTLPLQ